MKLTPEQEITEIACAMAKAPRKELESELKKLPLGKLLKVYVILANHLKNLEENAL